MAEHTFLVTVDVSGWPAGVDEYGRDERDYAHDALNVASLTRSSMLDGFADIEDADAYISDVIDA